MWFLFLMGGCARFLLVLLVAACLGTTAAAEWRKQPSGTLAWLHAVQFLDGDTGFAAGSNGTLLATANGGSDWNRIAVPRTDTIRDVHFLDRLRGWLLCDRGMFRSGGNASYLLKTIDGGKTWSAVEMNRSPERFSRMFFSRDGEGHLVGEGGIMSGLPDGKSEESRSVLPSKFLITDGTAFDGAIVLVGGGGSVVASDDGGRTWRAASVFVPGSLSKLNAVHFTDAKHGWAVGNRGVLIATSDGGRLWRPQASGTEADLLDVAFFDDESGFVVGDGGLIMRSADSGVNWAVERTAVKHRLERIAFAGRHVVAVGFGGTILAGDLP